MTSTRIQLVLSATVLAIGFALPANAQSVSDNLPVLANVVETCTLAIAAPVNFGTYDTTSLADDTDGQGSLGVTCTQGALATIALDQGSNGNRTMDDGAGNTLGYQLYSDGGRTTVWGTGGAAVSPGAAPSNATRTFSVFGTIPAGQNVPAGAFTDAVVVTVTW